MLEQGEFSVRCGWEAWVSKRSKGGQRPQVVLRATGRVLLSGIFVHGGYRAFRNPGGRPKQAAKLGIPHPEPGDGAHEG
jgi:hypothetical protein